MKRIPVSGPWITECEVELVANAARTAWGARAGEYEQRFTSAFAEHCGRTHAIATPSCTSAIHLALAALNIGPGDEVITPDITWIATAAPIDYVGATVVFADVDATTWCIDADAARDLITPNTRAIIAVNLYGAMPDMPALTALAHEHDIVLIEDAAESIGSIHAGRPAGSFGRASVFSFHGSKTLTTGEGGMLVTDDDALYERCLVLRDHGRPPGDRRFLNTDIAYKYRMSALQAALGCAQLSRLDELVAKKRLIFDWYAQRLADHPALTLNAALPDTNPAFWMVTALCAPSTGLKKFRMMDLLAERGIDTRPFFSPLSSLPAYAGHPQADRALQRNRTSYDLADQGVNLPSGLQLNEDDVAYVCGALEEIIAEHGASA
jgi:perosamine synthetase